ncbi:hypothetical protein ACIQ1D_18760 [Lysinibacillus xylanilyticus]|uniref:hypothetical protein n=1 Tax=Lysinibacillus xylanilyticus TaxID=582475 RepID=UPI00381701F2
MPITVRELREWLENQDDNAKVVVRNPFQRYDNVELIDTDRDNYKLEGVVVIKGY